MSHVSKIKNQFEKLNLNEKQKNNDSLNNASPSSVVIKDRNQEADKKFKRSATLTDFSKFQVDDCASDSKDKDTVKTHLDFQRQNSHSKSVRRRCAFRLDKNPNLLTSPTKLERQSPVKVTQINDCGNEAKLNEELEYIALSETIKKALRKPLPNSPAPPKPPRTFAVSPLNSPVNNVDIVEEIASIQSIITTNDDKKPILESNKKGISTFLNCIISPCSIDPIYYEQVKREQHLQKRKEEEEEEEIYSEPFFHLNSFDKSSLKNDELHYMCTNIIDQTNNSNYNTSLELSSLESNKESSDIENYDKINILMDVIYDEKHHDNIMEEETSGSSSETTKIPKGKLMRSLTEKRKNYVRRMTQSITENETNVMKNNDGSLKFPSTASIVNQFQRIIDSNSGGQKSHAKSDSKLFKMMLLVGYDILNKKGYIKSIYPKSEKSLPMIEQFIYPTDKNPIDYMTKENQNFIIILTNEMGENIFGYCRQIVPEGFDKCMPLTYCMITSVYATGFYFNLLKEIEVRHGLSNQQYSFMMKELHSHEFPKCNEILSIKLLQMNVDEKKIPAPEIPKKPDREVLQRSTKNQKFAKRLSLESPEWLKEEASTILQNRKTMDSATLNKQKAQCDKVSSEEIVIKREIDVRLENSELSVLYECLSKDLLIMIFGTILIERKVILLGTNLTKLSSCVIAIYSLLYPFKWQHPIISIVPEKIIELLQAPFPFFAGVLKTSININSFEIEDGIVVDIDNKVVIRKCSDEMSLLPESLKKSLILSLKVVEAIDKGKKLVNVLIAEAFLQFFVKLFANLNATTFDKNKFIDSHNDEATKYFLEWFTETIMFKEFLLKRQNLSNSDSFKLFEIKILEKSATLSSQQQRKNVEILLKSSKQKKRNFKDRIKDFLYNKN